MKTLWPLILLLLPVFARAEIDQYPEERTYTHADRGYTQYGAPSLHHTGKYAMTFDDGPHPIRTPKILDTLKKHNVKATFFVITTNITEATFPLIKRMLDEGHLVASHGRSHDNSNTLSKEVWKVRVKQSFLDLKKWYAKAGHDFDKFFYRFPYAAYGERVEYNHMNALKEISMELTGGNCIQFAFWDHDSGDWIPKMTGAEVLANYKSFQDGGKVTTYKTVRVNGKLTQIKVIKDYEAAGGGVVLQHDIQESSVVGTELFLKYAEENGLTTVRLDEVDEFAVNQSCKML